MARADRLLELLQVLRRRRRPASGQVLANVLGISIRTLYRDIDALRAQRLLDLVALQMAGHRPANRFFRQRLRLAGALLHLFSPRSTCPARTASRIRDGSIVLVTRTNRAASPARPDCRAAAAIRDFTSFRLAVTSASVAVTPARLAAIRSASAAPHHATPGGSGRRLPWPRPAIGPRQRTRRLERSLHAESRADRCGPPRRIFQARQATPFNPAAALLRSCS
nr:HTH domain-containing protein [Sphingomonas liriopis]